MDADRKKQLRDDYKSKLAVGGVYAITCSGNQRRLIKASVDIEGNKKRFAFAMTIKACPDPALQNEWLQYGSESFEFAVLEDLKMKEGQTAKEFADDVKALHAIWLEETQQGEKETGQSIKEP